MDLFAFPTHQDSNLMIKRGEFSTQKSSKRTTPSLLTLTEELKAVVFEKDKMELRDKSILIAILQFMAYQHFNSDVENNFHDLQKHSPALEKNYRLTFSWIKEAGRAEKKYEFDYPGMAGN